MCGITGIFDLKASREIDRNALQRMTNALAHRGPDGEGFYIAPGIGFGHRRLAIIDRQGGAQPFHTQARDGVLSFNGEIYNFQKLAQKLTAQGLRLQTRSDTEALAEGLAKHGADFTTKLRGMFAYSFWEPNKRQLLLARDRLGEKPLYYAQTSDGFLVFASEIGALIASGLINAEHNPAAVADYFFYGYVPDPKTIYRGVHKLPSAHMLTVSTGGNPELKQYWRPVFSANNDLNLQDAASELTARLDNAVSAQTISDVPLGAFLSGGIDSAAIVASMSQSGSPLLACTVGFNEDSHDERARARIIAKKFGADHTEYVANLDIVALIDEVAATYGEPFADSSAFSTYIVSKLARQSVTVALSGDGADELFAGYRRYPFFTGEERVRRLAPEEWRRCIFGVAGAIYPKLDWAPRPLRFKSTLEAIAKTSAEGYAAAVAINRPDTARLLLTPDLIRSLNDYKPESVIADVITGSGATDPLSMAQYADFQTWLPGRMLTKIDRASMAHSLEVRPPFLDHSLVEWSATLPPSFKLGKGDRKRILKTAMTPRLGSDYVSAPKQGFDLPIGACLRDPQNGMIDTLLQSKDWSQSGMLNEVAVNKMADSYRLGKQDFAQELWSVIMFDAFLRTSGA